MADAPPGSSLDYTGNSNGALKRPLSDGEGSSSSASFKRQQRDRDRERERDREPRDWRDVHLNRGGGSGGGGGRYRGGGNRRDSYRDRDRERERERDREREREREREHRDRERHRGKDRPREQDRRHDRSPRKQRTPPPATEREEGEISPRPPTPPPATPTPAPMEVDNAQPDLELAPSPPPVEKTLAERRARRLAILARYNSGSNPGSAMPSNGASPAPSESVNGSAPAPQAQPSEAVTQNGEDPLIPSKHPSRSPSPMQDQEEEQAQFTLAKNDSPSRPSAGEDQSQQSQTAAQDQEQDGDGPQVNAADYDPSLDRREDEFRRQGQGVMPPIPGVSVNHPEEEEEADEDEDEDLDDMFSISGPKTKKPKKKTGKKKEAAKEAVTQQLQRHALHSDSAADPEGYYNVILGEVLVAPPTVAGEKGERYQVYASVGRGMFAVVVRARVLSEGDDGKESKEGGKEVAIKIVRAQEVMHRAGLKESAILAKLQAADAEDKKHIVRLERTFEHRGHLCLVFESLSMNLRDVVKRFGKDVGLNIRAVRAYAHQLFIALGHLRKLSVIHADIKPDNILVNDAKTMLKLCDLGSASDAAENEITPYLVSRFYRAPEIILGVPYDSALDIWSVGCTLYELYTGKILFPGRSNNQMLLHMMELKGRFNGKMIKRAKFGDVYFDEMGGFESVEREKASGNDVIRKVHISKPSRDLRARLMPSGTAARLGDEETNVLLHFVDLLDRCLSLDPARRITPREALSHPFIRGVTSK